MDTRELELYTVEIYTGDKLFAGTDTKTFISFHSDEEHSPIQELSAEVKKKINRRNKLDIHQIVTTKIHNLNKVTLHKDGHWLNWYVEKVIIRASGKVYTAYFGEWIPTALTKPLVLTRDLTHPYMGGTMCFGPIVKFRGRVNRTWRLSVVVGTEGVGAMDPLLFSTSFFPEIEKSIPICYATHQTYALWRFDFEVKLLPKQEQICNYTLPDGRTFEIVLPAVENDPRIIFWSCNDKCNPYGISSVEAKDMCWKFLVNEHRSYKYHLMIGGGDQVYADSVFVCSDSMREYSKKGSKDRLKMPFTDQMRRDAECFYFKLYFNTWNQPDMSSMFAVIPTLMMWDDHDTYDGVGSLNPDVGESEVYLELKEIAKKHFFLFQMMGDMTNVIGRRSPEGPYSHGHLLSGHSAVLLLDIRTERRMFGKHQAMIMSEESWQNVTFWLDELRRCRIHHLFVVSTVPVVYPHRDITDWLLDVTNNDLLDDSRDHWSAAIHEVEQIRLLDLLFSYSRDTAAKVTILAGDVHVGCYGTIRSKRDGILIEQFVSSGICATPPPKLALLGFRLLLKNRYHLGEAYLKMGKLPNGKTFLAKSNFLCLLPTSDGGYIASWVARPSMKRYHPADQPLVLTTKLRGIR